ncbi:anti-phage protein KwaA [Pseudomonas sp. USTB-Z]|uniref:anti-phage protein KwaA n=1 Tax=Pseudomonas sp. USTB-Z TaxID=2794351 RepID=UPI002180A8D0|nr:anti-phage protein KwaA [Pseudomonas sp. USTB-Z]
MKDDWLIKVMLYVLSLWLLFVSLLIMSYDATLLTNVAEAVKQRDLNALCDDFNVKNLVFVVSALFILVGGLILWLLANSYRGGWSITCRVSDISDENHEHLEFLATYVMPLVFTDVESKRTVLNLALMIVAIGAIYVKTNKFYSNPSLAILGFKIFKATIHDRGEKQFVVICRGQLTDKSVIRYIRIDNNTCLAKLDK